jgi:hypothetical protein
MTPVTTPDLYWQLRAGHDIVTTHHAPTVDHFSWTHAGQPWIAPEWLTYVLAWPIYHSGGLGGIWIAYAATLAVLGILLWLTTRPLLGSSWLTFVWVLMAGLSFRVWLAPRPFLASYLLFPIFIGIMYVVNRTPGQTRLLWILPPLALIWANLHQGVVAGVAVVAYYGAGNLVLAGITTSKESKQERLALGIRLLLCSLLCAVATLINPYGFKLLQDAIATVRNTALLSHVTEWLPVTRVPQASLTSFYVYLALLIIIFALSNKKPEPLHIVLLLILLAQSGMHVRHIALFELASTILLAESFASTVGQFIATPSPREDIERLRKLALPASVIVVVAILLRNIAPALRQMSGVSGTPLIRTARVAFQSDLMPERACKFMEQGLIPPDLHLFNSYSIGGYLALNAPHYPVFIDGRTNLYFGSILDAYSRGTQSPAAFDALLDQYSVDLAVVSQNLERQALLLNPKWTLVCQDYIRIDGRLFIRALVFIRNRPQLAGLIAKCRQTSQ